MPNLSLQSLLDLSGIRIAYLLWARHNVTGFYRKGFKKLVEDVSSDVPGLPIPEQMKPIILKHVKPAGSHLCSLISLWLSLQPEDSHILLTNDMFFECLILNADGLINQRKTAEKILSSRILDSTFAFRLACLNFLEKEVLKLWIPVKGYFLNKIMLEGKEADAFIDGFSSKLRRDFNDRCFHMKIYSPEFLFIKEREEILFWISYCLSKENAISNKATPHFLGYDFDWYAFSLKFAILSGNLTCFDYYNNSCDRGIEYNCLNIIKDLFVSQKGEHDRLLLKRQLPCFMFHYVQLTSEEEAELFGKFPDQMLLHFLQWPLSQTFMDNHERLWNLIPETYKQRVFQQIFKVLIQEEILTDNSFCISFWDTIFGTYCSVHLVQIWTALWDICSNCYKSHFLDSIVFVSIKKSIVGKEFRTFYKTPGFKEKLYQVFLSSGDAILELFKTKDLVESLKTVVSKYMPEYFEEFNRRSDSFDLSPKRKEMPISRIIYSKNRNNTIKETRLAHTSILNCVKESLFSS